MNNKKSKQIVGNLSYAFVAQIISLSLSVLMSLIVPKLLDVKAFAYFQLFIFYSTYVGLFHFGMTDGVYLKYGGEQYQNLDKRLFGSQLWLMVFLEAIVSVGIIIFSCIWVRETERQFVLIATAVYILVANTTYFFGFVFQAVNYTKRYSISVMIAKISYIVFIAVLMITRPEDVRIFIILYILAQIFAAIYCVVLGKDIAFAKLVPLKETISAFVEHAKIGINLTFANIASTLILGCGRFVVDGVWGINAFGKFSFALSLSAFFLQFINQVSMVLFPVLRQSNEGELKQFYNVSRMVLGLFLPLIFLAYLPMKFILGLWLPQYQISLVYLALLLPICTFDGKMNLLCNTYFKVLRKEKVLLRVNILTMFISLIFSLIGAYIIGSIYAVVLFMVAVIAFRSIISELYLAKLMGAKVILSIIQEVVLAVIFMFCAWNVGTVHGFFIFLFIYIVYLLFNWSMMKSLLQSKTKNKKGLSSRVIL